MARQTNLRLIFSAIHKKPTKDSARSFVGEVTLVKEHTPVCKIKFWVDETRIYITDLDVHERHRRCGYGRLTMDYIMFLAEVLRKPIFLYSEVEAVKFYEKLGMEHLNSPKMKRKIRVLNENPKYKHHWDDEDFIWIPKCLRRQKRIWIDA